jgi:hypothetical protein
LSRRSKPLILIRQTGSFVENQAFDFAGSTGYILSLIITANLPAFAISAFGLEVPWGDGAVRFLEDPLEIDGTSEVYRFGGKGEPEFHRDQVINHFADVRHIMARGHSVAGLLLAVGTEPIPETFAHGIAIPAFLKIVDQFGREYREPVSFWRKRSERRRPVTQKKRKSLLECRDPVPR